MLAEGRPFCLHIWGCSSKRDTTISIFKQRFAHDALAQKTKPRARFGGNVVPENGVDLASVWKQF